MSTLTMAMLCCGLIITISSRTERAPERPNVILIIADDMAWDDCGANCSARAG